MRNGNGNFDPTEDKTPVADAAGEAAADTIAVLLSRLRALDEDLRPTAQMLPAFKRADRRLYFRKLSKELREIGGAAHDAARVVEQLERELRG